MSDNALPSCVEPDHPDVAALCADLPTTSPLATAAAVLHRLGPVRRRWGAGHRPLAVVLADRSANCMEHALVLVSALRRLGVPAAGLIGTARGTAPICVHAVALVADGGRWYVLDVDRPAPVALDDVVAAGELRPMVAWHESSAVVLPGRTGAVDDLYDLEGSDARWGTRSRGTPYRFTTTV